MDDGERQRKGAGRRRKAEVVENKSWVESEGYDQG